MTYVICLPWKCDTVPWKYLDSKASLGAQFFIWQKNHQLVFFTAPFIGHMTDRWSMRGITFMSGIIGAAGMLVSAFAPNIECVIVGYGVLYGKYVKLIGLAKFCM